MAADCRCCFVAEQRYIWMGAKQWNNNHIKEKKNIVYTHVFALEKSHEKKWLHEFVNNAAGMKRQ